MLEKLGLGTVQFGQPYGISNQRGQVPKDEAVAILKRAASAGIKLLDTAANYGEAETILGGFDTSAFRIVTKTIHLSQGLDQVIARARQSERSLKADTLLVHAAKDLEGAEGERLWRALTHLKDEGVFRKIGISVYVADDPARLAEKFHPDVMQLPFSLLDQRVLENGTLARLKAMGVEVHARSLFLQGLLFLKELPEKLQRVAPHLMQLRTTLKAANVTPLAAALGFALRQPEIAFGLVGVTSMDELEDIIAAAKRPLPALDWASFALKDELVLTPSLW